MDEGGDIFQPGPPHFPAALGAGAAWVTVEGSRPVTERSSRIRMLLDHSMAALPKNAGGGMGEQPAGAGEGSLVMAFPIPPSLARLFRGIAINLAKGEPQRRGRSGGWGQR